MWTRDRAVGGRAIHRLIAAAGCLAVASAFLVASSTPAAAAATCNGKLAEVLTATEDDFSFDGTEGDDVVVLRGTDAWYRAHGGDDTVCVESGLTTVDAGDGDDWVSGERASDGLTLDGEAGKDTLIGSSFVDHVWTSDGDDAIRAGEGADDITISSDDKVTKGHDVRTGSGEDTLTIDGEEDSPMTIRLQEGNLRTDGGLIARFSGPSLYVISGTADVKGTDKADHVQVSGEVDLSSGDGDDRIRSYNSEGTIRSGAGNDTVEIERAHGSGTVALGPGDDAVTLWNGNGVTVRGGKGDDRFRLRARDDNPDGGGYPKTRATFLGQSGSDTFKWNCKATANIAKERLSCDSKPVKISFGGMQTYRGGKHKDTFYGSSRPDTFYGKGENDTMYGKKGRDTLIGGKGYDTADGGPGKDTCKAENMVKC